MSQSTSNIRKVAFLGNYLPRQCGIATFTSDLCGSVAAEYPEAQCFVVPVSDIKAGYEYPPEVRFEITEQDLSSYQRARDFLNLSNVDALSLQHEFGIFGGPAGSHLLTALQDLKTALVTTFHTVLRDPSPDYRRVMEELVHRSTRLVVMSQHGCDLLQEIYHVPIEKIDLIPHGIPDMPFVDANFYKDQFGVEGRFVLLTFGLLSPGKGIEFVLNALPKVVAEYPEVVYVILGATHPNLLREQGESYRLSLERLARKNGIQRNVIFHNRFVGIDELKEFIGAADVYLTPYVNEQQITSGTLAYAVGAGKAVISTPYWHATELLADDRGVLVPFRDADAIAREVLKLMDDPTRRHAMRKNAYLFGREMIWSNVAKLYMRSFEKARLERGVFGRKVFAVKTLDEQPRQLPELKLEHLCRMTDSTGLFQHAKLSVPDFAQGYCTDDNARALILTVLLQELGEEVQNARALGTTYAAFVNHAFHRETGRFRNFMSFDRRWLEAEGSQDSFGRALWALGTCVGRSSRRSIQALAGQLFDEALPGILETTAPRAWAFALLGIHEYLRALGGDRLVTQAREMLTGQLMGMFDRCHDKGWIWCEECLTYDNAKIAHALIQSGHDTGNETVMNRALDALRWLAEVQTSEHGCFRPVGCLGFFPRGGTRAHFDQQPIEAHAMVSACLEAFRLTGDALWQDYAMRAFDWFLGWNDLGQPLYSPNTGGCYDALHIDRVNENQGAESTLAFLLSLTEIKLMQTALSLNEPSPLNGQAAAESSNAEVPEEEQPAVYVADA